LIVGAHIQFWTEFGINKSSKLSFEVRDINTILEKTQCILPLSWDMAEFIHPSDPLAKDIVCFTEDETPNSREGRYEDRMQPVGGTWNKM